MWLLVMTTDCLRKHKILSMIWWIMLVYLEYIIHIILLNHYFPFVHSGICRFVFMCVCIRTSACLNGLIDLHVLLRFSYGSLDAISYDWILHFLKSLHVQSCPFYFEFRCTSTLWLNLSLMTSYLIFRCRSLWKP